MQHSFVLTIATIFYCIFIGEVVIGISFAATFASGSHNVPHARFFASLTTYWWCNPGEIETGLFPTFASWADYVDHTLGLAIFATYGWSNVGQVKTELFPAFASVTNHVDHTFFLTIFATHRNCVPRKVETRSLFTTLTSSIISADHIFPFTILTTYWCCNSG